MNLKTLSMMGALLLLAGTGANWATGAMFLNRYLSAHLVIQYPIGVRMLFK